MARLILVTTEGQQVIELGASNSLGRGPTNTIPVPDKLVSDKHCVIALREIPRRPHGEDMRARTFCASGLVYSLRDLGSAAGTYLNGERIRNEQFLLHGDELRFGSTRAHFANDSGVPLSPPPSPGPSPQPTLQGVAVLVTRSERIDAPDCKACAKRRPWQATVAAVEANLTAHDVSWPHFKIMHGRDLTCDAAASSREDRGLYVVATNPHGVEAKSARVFNRSGGWYVGVSSIIKDTAF